ncbi:hypothetical protein M422DRAFT_268939, partial [Sphaerobolus stellatus SS14]
MIGAALSAALSRKRAIALSYGTFIHPTPKTLHDPAHRLAIEIISKLWSNWGADPIGIHGDGEVDLFNVNIPVVEKLLSEEGMGMTCQRCGKLEEDEISAAGPDADTASESEDQQEAEGSVAVKSAPLVFNFSPEMQALVKPTLDSLPEGTPPINAHNRTYVNLLKPKTDIQQANNEYTTYDRFKVSSIPHIHFGHLQGGINVWIAFPRMTHKQQDSPYFATQIPLLVQDRWFAFILIPAIKKIYGRGSKEYVNHSPQEYKARAAGKTETRLVDRIKLQELQDQIHTIIREDRDEDLSIFGSFFFIMDIRGIKLTNKDRDHLGNDPFEVLADVIPALDFDY